MAKLYTARTVRRCETQNFFISDQDFRFTSRFWRGLSEAMGTKCRFSTAFHPLTDGYSERMMRILEVMIRGCVLDFEGVGLTLPSGKVYIQQ